jgi:hypothetical protein
MGPALFTQERERENCLSTGDTVLNRHTKPVTGFSYPKTKQTLSKAPAIFW